MSLADKIRRARESVVEEGGHRFTIRRPTDEEFLLMRDAGASMLAAVKAHVIGWDLAELDLIPGGGPEKVPFDPDAFAEWVADQPELWGPLGTAVLESYTAHAEKRSAAAKN